MTYEEQEQMEAQRKAAQKKQRTTWLLILTPIIIIATCNYYVNTHQEEAIVKNPEPGDYFVFSGLIGTGDQPFKLKAATGDSLEFFIPKYEFTDFRFNRSESKVYELEKKGELYDATYTLKLRKSTVDSLRENANLGVRLGNTQNNVYLKQVFGRNRGNAVESTLEKAVGGK